MLDIILNEIETINNFKKDYQIPKNIKITDIIYLLTKSYCLEGKEKQDIYMSIMKDLEKALKDDFIYTQWTNTVRNTVNKYFRKKNIYRFEVKLNNIEEIRISQNELNNIKQLNNLVLEKIAFVMLVYAKISKIQMQQDNNEYWIKETCSTICKEAKVGLKGSKQKKMLNELYKNKYISMSKSNNKTNIKLNYGDKEDIYNEDDLIINDFDGIIYQYLIWKGEKWKKCENENCNKWTREKNNKTKYCKSCAREILQEQKNKWKREKWNKSQKEEK